MFHFKFARSSYVFRVAILLLISGCACFASSNGVTGAAHYKYLALALSSREKSSPVILDRDGIPFIESALHVPVHGSTQVDVGSQVKRVFLLGMSESASVHAWADAMDNSQRFFIGDNLGQIRLEYVDGSVQVFPLILGESVWLGRGFYICSGPFPTDLRLQKALAGSLHLYPPAPVEDGNYVAMIVPKPTPIRDIEFENSPLKKGSVVISGITVETAGSSEIAGATALHPGNIPLNFDKFMAQKPLRLSSTDEKRSQQRLADLRRAFYLSDELIPRHMAVQIPSGYLGPEVSFKGTIYADILTNAFYANVDDMLAKIDADGTYHTSTRGAGSWSGGEFGTYCPNLGKYYTQSWSRDMGRSLQELAELGYLGPVTRAENYGFRMAQLWAQNPSLKYHGHSLPPHWSRVINNPDYALPFENDGHGLISLSLYELWLRLPDRNAWLRAHWTDVKVAGDWIPWQFDHPAISGAADGALNTTGESAAGSGKSVYADAICMTALEGLAKMADSIGETQSAELWRDTAEKMRQAIPRNYLITDPKYGRVWTLVNAGWPDKSTVLGPLIFTADYEGFAPQDIDPAWREADEAAYRRLIDTYRPFGFYGQAMGYGQGFVTQSALLLDRMHNATWMLDWMAKETYDPRFGTYIVPEGVQVDPNGRFWYRAGDVGNGVQEAEIVKALRIVIGVDDNHPNQLRIFPRMPYGWQEMTINKYPALVERQGNMQIAHIRYDLRRIKGHMSLEISANRPLGPVTLRLGPFEDQPRVSDVSINGKPPVKPSIEHSGDSWWVSSTLPTVPFVPLVTESSSLHSVTTRHP